ncbi:MAG: hypothetical protein DRO88_09020 [Promethearchaeia archaeon]|nr:MAG: hypothetical protein DRO88_09020 [Candidatus Lokiarchaeia archaeon]
MSQSFKKSSSQINVDVTTTSDTLNLQPKSVSLKSILKEAWILFKKTALPTLGLVILLSLITAVFRLVYIPGDWYIHANQSSYNSILEKLSSGQTELTQEENSLRFAYQIITSLTLWGRWSIPFFALLSVVLFSTGKIYFLQTHEPDSPQTWKESILVPFHTKSQGFTAVLYILIYPLLITVGLLIFIIPGIYIFLRGIFIIHSIIVDEHGGRMAFRGGKFYLRDNVKPLIVVFLIGVLIPLFIGSLVSNPIMKAIGYSEDKYFTLIDPSNQHIGLVLVYYICMHILENIWFLPAPALFGSAFFHIRQQKLELYRSNSDFEIKLPSSAVDLSSGAPAKVLKEDMETNNKTAYIYTVIVDPATDFYYCPVCKKKLPLSARKCTKCGALIQLLRK